MTRNEKLDILKSNLHKFEVRQSISKEQRTLTLCEIARILCDEYEGEDLAEITKRYSELITDSSTVDKIILCRELLSRVKRSEKHRQVIGIGDNESVPAGSHGKIAFPKNKFNDTAFEHFSMTISAPRAVYVASINNACEAVADGTCEFCILPIENSLDGKLFGFYALLDRFELKICAVCDIESDGDSHIRYALVGRSCRELSYHAGKDKSFILEFFVLDSGGGFLDGLLSAAKVCNAELLSIDARPVPYDTQSKKFILSFRVNSNDGILFRTFLALNYDSYSPIGLYPYV